MANNVRNQEFAGVSLWLLYWREHRIGKGSDMTQKSRPLSPHLEIYKFQITMAMSIVQRITGVALYFGIALVAWWLVAAATSNAALDVVYMLLGNWFGTLILIGFTWALFHHMLGGVRHLVWDLGIGLGEKARFAIAWGTLVGGLALTAFVWIFFVWL